MDPEAEEFRKRVVQVIDLAFAGSQRSLADAIKMSPALVSRVASGIFPPSKRLLQAIGKLPQVNSKWLRTGKGKPIQTQPQVLTDLGAIVPVAKELLAGPLLDSEDLLSHKFLSVPRAFYSPTTYAIEVKSCMCDSLLLKQEFLKPDDTLIVETAPDRLSEIAGTDSKMLRVMYLPEFGAALATSDIDYFRIAGGLQPSKNEMDNPKTIDGRKFRAVELDTDEKDLTSEKPRRKLSAISDRHQTPTVVGVVTMLMREYLHS